MTDPGTPHSAAGRTGYAPVNGLEMYYEIHGDQTDAPTILLLHGAYMMDSGDFGPFLTGLAATRQVIATSLQGHGRTGDADRPMTYEGMGDDCAALLGHLGAGPVDVVGYSMGGATGFQLVIRHPEVVRKFVSISAATSLEASQPELAEMVPMMSPEMFAGTPFESVYKELSPNPDGFPALVEKIKQLDMVPFDWSADVQRITTPTMLVIGDADAVQAEYAVQIFRQLGGGRMGDMAGLTRARLAILPGTTHYIPPGIGMMDRHAWLLPMITAFLDEPMPEAADAGATN